MMTKLGQMFLLASEDSNMDIDNSAPIIGLLPIDSINPISLWEESNDIIRHTEGKKSISKLRKYLHHR